VLKKVKPLSHMTKEKIFSFPFSLKKKKPQNMTTNNERKIKGAIPSQEEGPGRRRE
jgi:hypothetical protein